jgi:ribosomal protein S6E (S10)
MKQFALLAALGVSCLAIAGCSRDDSAANDANAVYANEVGAGNEGAAIDGANASAGAAFPKEARIVEENGVTCRIDADGTRVALTDKDSRILVEGDKRYRVDPDGNRVRINDRGLAIDIDAPDVDVGINDKGHPDIDVKTKGDNNAGPD